MNAEVMGQVGPEVASDGAEVNLRLGKGAELIVSELHGKYAEQSYRGNVFVACQTAGVQLATVAGTAPSFSLFNPASSGKYLALIRWDMVLTVAAGTPVIGAYMLTVNTNPIAAATTGTAVVPIPGIVGGTSTAVGKPLTSATLPANPTLYRPFVNHLTGAITTIPNMPGFFIDFDGTCLIAPGCTISVGQLNVDTSNASALCGVIWEEIPV
jgi:hypothetical protein